MLRGSLRSRVSSGRICREGGGCSSDVGSQREGTGLEDFLGSEISGAGGMSRSGML